MPYRNLVFALISFVGFIAAAISNDIYWVGNYSVLVLGFLSFGTLFFPRVGYAAMVGTLSAAPIAVIIALISGSLDLTLPYLVMFLIAFGGMSLIPYMRPEYEYNYQLVVAKQL